MNTAKSNSLSGAEDPPYLPGLDGLRALAVMLVLAYHARAPFAKGGFIGVDVFFVLSSFLITRSLRAEWLHHGSIRIGAFYLRRARRLYPALILMLAAYLLFADRWWPEVNHLRDALLAAAYLSNYSFVLIQAPVILSHTWSLAVEEQFYLIWPLLLTQLLRRQSLIVWLLGLYIAATVWRVAAVLSEMPAWAVYLRFDTRASGLMLGALLAVAMPYALSRPRRSLAAALIALLIVNLYARWLAPGYLLVGISMVELISCVLILSLVQRPGLFAHPAAVFVGRMPYGMYLWHYPIMRAVRDDWHWTVTLVFGTLASLLLAWISARTVERWTRAQRGARQMKGGPAGRAQ